MNLFELFATIKLDGTQFYSGLSSAEKKIKSFAGSVNHFTSGVEKIAKKSILTLGTVGTALATIGVTYNSQIEDYKTSFTTLLGSAEKAAIRVSELKEMAARTPFGLNDLASATKTMLSFGVSSKAANEMLTKLGDIALGDKNKLSSLALVFGQVSSYGKLAGQDLLQFVNVGFNPLNYIAQATGASMQDLKDVMAGGGGSKEYKEKVALAKQEVRFLGDNASESAKMLVQMGKDGYISADLVKWAIDRATSAMGDFYRGSESASKTLTGMLSTLKDDASALTGEVFRPLSGFLKESLVPELQKSVELLYAAYGDGGLYDMIDAAGDIAQETVKKIGESAPDAIKNGSHIVNAVIQGINNTLPSLVVSGGSVLDAVISGIKSSTPLLKESARQLGPSVIGGIIAWKGTMLTAGIEIVSGIAQGISDDAAKGEDSKIRASVSGIVSDVTKSISDNAGTLITGGLDFITSIAKGMSDNTDKITKAVSDAVSASAKWLENPDNYGPLLTAVSKVGGAVLQGLVDGIFGDGAFASFDNLMAKVFGFFGLPYEKLTGAESTENGSSGPGGRGYNEDYKKEQIALERTKEYRSELEQMSKEYANALTFWKSEKTGIRYSGGTMDQARAYGEATESGVPFHVDSSGNVIMDFGGAEDSAKKAADAVNEVKKATDNLPKTVDIDVNINVHSSKITLPDGTNLTIEDDEIDGSHAGGLPYVPYDGYIAELHRGERVLTRSDADSYRKSGGSGGATGPIQASATLQAGTININNAGDAKALVAALASETTRQMRAIGVR